MRFLSITNGATLNYDRIEFVVRVLRSWLFRQDYRLKLILYAPYAHANCPKMRSKLTREYRKSQYLFEYQHVEPIGSYLLLFASSKNPSSSFSSYLQ